MILIVESGIYFSNQTGGYGCLHPAEEGIYIPLYDEKVDQEYELSQHFTGSKWQSWCNEAIDEETADFIDTVLEKSSNTRMLKVDRSRLNDSHEAWVYVTLDPQTHDADSEIFSEVGVNEGVLTWENSD